MDKEPKSDDDSEEESRHRKHKKRSKDDDDESNRSEDSGRDRKRSSSSRSKRKHKRKKHSSKRRRDDSGSDSEDSDSRSYSDGSTSTDEDRKHKRSKKHHHKSKRKHKDKKHHKKDKKHSKRDKKRKDKDDDEAAASAPAPAPAVPVFGQYGILKASDFYKKQRSFEVWMAEVKGMAEYKGPKWETQNYFDEYREDYNTATLPHIKYYDFEKWEMEEYQKQQSKQRELADSGKSTRQADEVRHQLEQRKLAQHKQKADQNLVLSMMSREKVQEMKRQQQLKTELEIAFKTGDQEAVKKLKKKLEPEEKLAR